MQKRDTGFSIPFLFCLPFPVGTNELDLFIVLHAMFKHGFHLRLRILPA